MSSPSGPSKQAAWAGIGPKSIWLLEASGTRVGVTTGCIAELLERPNFAPVPRMAAHALGLVLWRGNFCAAVDLARLIAGPKVQPARPDFAVVTTYVVEGAMHYGVIALEFPPSLLTMEVCRECPRPPQTRFPEQYAASWLLVDRGDAVPLLSVRTLFEADPG